MGGTVNRRTLLKMIVGLIVAPEVAVSKMIATKIEPCYQVYWNGVMIGETNQPLLQWDGTLLDGHHRLEAAKGNNND